MQVPIRIDPQSSDTLQSQIVAQFQELILQGRLRPGRTVPSSRDLSEQLHVSRNTVSGAYEQLIEQGDLRTRPGLGTFVRETLPDQAVALHASNRPLRTPSRARATRLPIPYTARGVPGLHQPPDPSLQFDFSLGGRDPRLFPEKIWRRLVTECLGGAGPRISDYIDPSGLPELREQIAEFIGPARGMNVSPEQILIVAGCQQGLNLAAHLFVGANTPVVVEAPCYRGAAYLFESYGARLVPVPVDEHGLQVDQLPTEGPKLAYVTPSHQFPTGATLSEERRIALLDWAAEKGVYLLEVDYDADFSYDDAPLPSLYGLDPYGCTIYVSSFSRCLGPGLRLGYMVVPENLLRPATTIKALIDNGLPWLEQAALVQFMREGSFLHHLKRVRSVYRDRRDALLGGLARHFPEGRVSGAQCGSHVAWWLPPTLPSAAEVRELARAYGVGVYPLGDSPSWFYEALSGRRHVLLLGYTRLEDRQIEAAVDRLAAALQGEFSLAESD